MSTGDVRIFVSVGGTATPEQEDFVRAIEDRLRAERLIPQTVGRNTFSSDAPLKAVDALMRQCSGAVVIGLERSWFERGLDRRGGPKEALLADVRLPTPWNQIEAAMAYAKGLPLLVIVVEGIRPEGLLEPGYDWYVLSVPMRSEALSSPQFNGVLASWREKVLARHQAPEPAAAPATPAVDPTKLTIGQIVGALRPTQLWTLVLTAAAVVGGAFSLGGRLFGP
jgi:hypothetical protein